MNFKLESKYKPAGDQPKAISKLTQSIQNKHKYQTLLGITGSGKTFTIANVIQKLKRPTLVLAHNKTLAAQLVQEYRNFFPNNAVEYFVSYYDYYQPEAYIPSSDTYIEKDASINEEIDRMRNSATEALLSREDVIVVASVSCIYGLGNPINYEKFTLTLETNQKLNRQKLIENLIDIGYERNEDNNQGSFKLRGNNVEISLANKDIIFRVVFRGDKIEAIEEYNSISRELIKTYQKIKIFPARHFILSNKEIEDSVPLILAEMKKRVKYFLKNNLYLEAERLERRVTQDMAMLRELGYVNGIENYSRFLTGREKGEPPYTLLDYFPKNFLTVIDESHVTVPQLNGMYEGDKSRKNNLIKYGFRLPSARDNRPLKFEEFIEKTDQMIFTSATPGKFEKNNSKALVEQIIRPTGLVDPKIIIENSENQIQDIIEKIKKIDPKERVLVTTLTKKNAEELSEYLKENKIKACYLHSDVDTLDRIRILNQLRKGEYKVLVGVNLLREGLDLPEVSLVGILDSDQEGFLRNETSLIQTIGRAARNVSGKVVLYKQKDTKSLELAIKETKRRRRIQLAYNKKHNITPETIKKEIKSIASDVEEKDKQKINIKEFIELKDLNSKDYIKQKEKEMKIAAENLEFEKAAVIRDEINVLKNIVS
jgi:excinuclease ABC subunit B